jgi:hypothetical protein
MHVDFDLDLILCVYWLQSHFRKGTVSILQLSGNRRNDPLIPSIQSSSFMISLPGYSALGSPTTSILTHYST